MNSPGTSSESPSVSGHTVTSVGRPVGATLLTVASLLWLGMLLGVSFLATPVKFLAPSLSLPVALEVGRYTFAVFSWVEVAAAVAVLASAWSVRLGARVLVVAILLAAIVAFQVIWLLPLLDARVELIIQGAMPEPAGYHNLYVVLDLIKAALLGYLSWLGLRT
jgi:hypothetical protein